MNNSACSLVVIILSNSFFLRRLEGGGFQVLSFALLWISSSSFFISGPFGKNINNKSCCNLFTFINLKNEKLYMVSGHCCVFVTRSGVVVISVESKGF